MSVKVHEAFSLDSFQDRLLFFDDFHGDQLQDEWSEGGVAGTAVVVDAQTGGIVRFTTGATAFDDYHIQWGENPNEVRSLHVDKKATMEFRLKLAQTNTVMSFTYLYFDGNNGINFQYDSSVDTNWQIRCMNGGAPTLLDSGVAVDTDYHIFRIECHTHGANHVHFYIDGVETANSPITTNIPDDAADYLMPRLFLRTRENVAKIADCDYVYVRQER